VITHPCVDCGGRAYVKQTVRIDVAIPPGIDDGMRVRLSGEGEPSPDGGLSGDCYCFVHVRPHHLFHRDGPNLILQMPITYSQAALGATIEIPTLEGPDKVEIPRGSQSGEVFRLRSKGLADPHGGPVGDLLVQTYIEIPKKLDKQQERLLRQLAELEHANVTPERKGFLDKIRHYFSASDSDVAGEN
jgi:molecular chaperone DnaJ